MFKKTNDMMGKITGHTGYANIVLIDAENPDLCQSRYWITRQQGLI